MPTKVDGGTLGVTVTLAISKGTCSECVLGNLDYCGTAVDGLFGNLAPIYEDGCCVRIVENKCLP